MKKENTKLEDIKALVKRGMSFAVALTLAGTMSACDEPNLPDETIDPSFGITEPSDTTPGNTETNPDNNETEKEPEPLSPELQAKYPAISEEEYSELMNLFVQNYDAYKSGIKNIILKVRPNGQIIIEYYHYDKNTPWIMSSLLDAEKYEHIIEIAGEDKILLDPIEYGVPSSFTLYNIPFDEQFIHKDKIASILNIIYSDFYKEQTME